MQWFPLTKYTVAAVATVAEIEIFLSQRRSSTLSHLSLLSLKSVFPYIATVAETRFSTTAAIVATGAIIWKPGLSVPVSAHQDSSLIEVNSIQHWAVRNRMKLNLTKIWEMVVHGRISKPLPPVVQGIERKSWLKLLGIIFQENPSDWDLHFDNLLRKASSRLYILCVCKYFGYLKEQLTKLFDLLVNYVSVFIWN